MFVDYLCSVFQGFSTLADLLVLTDSEWINFPDTSREHRDIVSDVVNLITHSTRCYQERSLAPFQDRLLPTCSNKSVLVLQVFNMLGYLELQRCCEIVVCHRLSLICSTCILVYPGRWSRWVGGEKNETVVRQVPGGMCQISDTPAFFVVMQLVMRSSSCCVFALVSFSAWICLQLGLALCMIFTGSVNCVLAAHQYTHPFRWTSRRLFCWPINGWSLSFILALASLSFIF